MLAIIVLVVSCDSPPAGSVVGKWTEQGSGAWEFTADGQAIIKSKIDATYKLAGDDMLTIDFHDQQHLTITYKYELSEKKLILSPETATGDGALPTDWEVPTVLVRTE